MRLGMEGDELGQLLARASHCGVLTGLPPGSVPEMTASNPPEPELDPPVQAPVETVEVAHRESEETQASFQRIPESQVPAPVESVEVVHREPEETPKELPDTLEAQIPSPMESVEVAYREPEERSEPLSGTSEPAALPLSSVIGCRIPIATTGRSDGTDTRLCHPTASGMISSDQGFSLEKLTSCSV